MIQAIYPQGRLEPAHRRAGRNRGGTHLDARRAAATELVRARLQGLGPVTARDLEESLEHRRPVHRGRAGRAGRRRLRAARAVHRGSQRARGRAVGDTTLEWCERRLLARIHRYTIKTLRAEIEPVSGADFMRFLFDWQGVTRQPQARRRRESRRRHRAARRLRDSGRGLGERRARRAPQRIRSALAGQPVPRRTAHCGRGSRRPKSIGAAPVRTTPIALVTRKNWSLWHSLAAAPHEEMQLSHGARALFDYLERPRRLVLRRPGRAAPTYCAPRPRRRSASWYRRASSMPTAIRGCARC